MTGRRRRVEGGFTLLELIVAAAILALIAVFSWRGLDALLREREAIASSQGTVDVLQRSFALIERDALLARDVQLDGNGAMRMSAGPASSVDGDEAATVEYRVHDGALTRTVVGADRIPLTLITGVASVAMEAWAPSPRGGAWVRTKAAAPEAPPPNPQTRPQAAPGAGTSTASGGAASAASPAGTGAQAAPEGSPLGTTLPATQQSTTPPVPPGGATPPAAAIAAATGVRLTIAFGDGTQIVRAFLIGGA